MAVLKKIIVACDSFKGCLSSSQVADAVQSGIRRVLPDCEVHKIVAPDGGEGTAHALIRALGAQGVTTTVRDPLMRPIEAYYGILGDSMTAILDMASASGLTLLAPGERNPMLTTTFGTGQLIRDAAERGCRRFFVGIGGSATNDGGVGMLSALGFRFLDATGRELFGGGEVLSKIRSIDAAGAKVIIDGARFVVACDVTNPLTGPRGAAHVFGPQKAAPRPPAAPALG